jgi:hypothetical protein
MSDDGANGAITKEEVREVMKVSASSETAKLIGAAVVDSMASPGCDRPVGQDNRERLRAQDPDGAGLEMNRTELSTAGADLGR